jgi:glycosyltransferase involved in cell wall biosynthesis
MGTIPKQGTINKDRKAIIRIGILGTRGIPNNYGGFEQFAEKFATRMAAKGHELYVYTSHNHPYKGHRFENVSLIKCFDPEYRMGTAGQFVYDLNCVLDSRKRAFDILLQLGYTSSTVWSWAMPGKALIVTNMDGLEWKRTKYSKATQWFLLQAERWGAKHSDQLIADSPGIQDYLQHKYQVDAFYIPYGADVYVPADNRASQLNAYRLRAYEYDLVVARFEPENNIETVLKSYATITTRKLVLVGNYDATGFGRQCYRNYSKYEHIRFIGAVYGEETLNELRYYSRLYVHGHSVGGTNPSLLEAMACHALIVAHDNVFNRSVLEEAAFYFLNEHELINIIERADSKDMHRHWLEANKKKVVNEYNWDRITNKLEELFRQWI